MRTNQARPVADPYDVLVVGGGAAGLGAALALGRSRRSVLVIDAGDPRNAPAGHVHNYLGREGTPPLELLATGRGEVAAYGVEVVSGRVSVVRPWRREGIGFEVVTDEEREVAARRVVVATGLTDVLPELSGLAERWGRDVLHCPYCHGWEVRGQAVAVLATNARAAHQALLFSQLSDDVAVVLAAGAPAPTDVELERLSVRGVRVVADPPVEVVVERDALHGLRLASGELLRCDAVVVAPAFRARAAFLAPLGLVPQSVEIGGEVLGTAVPAEPSGATTVPGVWVAGNVTEPMAQVLGAAAGGLRVGAALNLDLITEDTDAGLVAQRARLQEELFEQPAWEQRYGAAAPVWSGRVNPQLEAEAASLAPGHALDVGSGEGADVLWLAGRGWTITGIDFSTVALRKAAEHAEAAGVGQRTEWRHVDVRGFDPGADPHGERWDLVTSQYMHLPDGGMLELTRRLAGGVAQGGTLLVVGHHPDDHATGLRHGHESFLFTPADLLPALDPALWEIEVAEVRPRTVTTPDGEVVEVGDSVLRARRR